MNENAPKNNSEEGVDMSFVDMAEGKPSVMEAVKEAKASGDPVAVEEAVKAADTKFIVNQQPGENVENLKKDLQGLATQMNALPSQSDEFNEIQAKFFEAQEKYNEAVERPLRDKLKSEAAPIAERITDKSFDTLKTHLTNLKVKPGMGDPMAGFSSGPEAVAYAQAVLESGLSDAQKYELMKDVYAAMVGYNGDTAANIVSENIKELKAKVEKETA